MEEDRKTDPGKYGWTTSKNDLAKRYKLQRDQGVING